MTQAERDRLVALKKAKKKLISQKQAAEELGLTERHVRRLLRGLKKRGDKAVVHALRGLPSHRGISADTKQEAVTILEDAYNQHDIEFLAMLSHPDLRTLKDEPRYQALARKIDDLERSPASPTQNLAAMGFVAR